MGTVWRMCSCMMCASDVVREGIELRRPWGSTYVQRCTLDYPWCWSSRVCSSSSNSFFVKNFEILTASGSVKRRRSMHRKLRIFKHEREFRSERFKHYKIWATPRRVSSEAYEGSYGKLVKMWMKNETTWPWTIMMWRTTSILKKTSRV
jgi:hypothetical protein